jgi:hypothetical protein
MSSADAVWATSGSSSIEGVAAAVRGAGGARRSMGAARSDAAGKMIIPMKKTERISPGLIMEFSSDHCGIESQTCFRFLRWHDVSRSIRVGPRRRP